MASLVWLVGSWNDTGKNFFLALRQNENVARDSLPTIPFATGYVGSVLVSVMARIHLHCGSYAPLMPLNYSLISKPT